MASTVKLSDLIPSRFVHLTPPNEENIERIKDDLLNGSKILLNNPHVFKNEAGKYEILAGHDRVEAARRAGWTEVPVRDFRAGLNTDDAIFAHFCKENLLRKDISKAAIAGEWLRKHPDWTDGRVAAQSGCTQQHVSDVRAEMIAAGNLQHVVSRVGLDEKVRRVSEEPRKPRQKPPKKGPLAAKATTTPAKPKSTDDIATEMVARAEAARLASEEAERERRAEKEAPGAHSEAPTDDTEKVSSGVGANAAPVPTGATELGAEDNSANFDINAGSVQDRSKSSSVDGGLEDQSPRGAPQLSDPAGGPPVSSHDPAFVGVGVVSLPTWVLSALAVEEPTALPEAALLALDDEACKRLDVLSVALKSAATRSRLLRSKAVAA